jgi:hypothetical protein
MKPRHRIRAGDRTVDPGAVPHRSAFPKVAVEAASHGADWPQIVATLAGSIALPDFKEVV